jgi:hypothetical protein
MPCRVYQGVPHLESRVCPLPSCPLSPHSCRRMQACTDANSRNIVNVDVVFVKTMVTVRCSTGSSVLLRHGPATRAAMIKRRSVMSDSFVVQAAPALLAAAISTVLVDWLAKRQPHVSVAYTRSGVPNLRLHVPDNPCPHCGGTCRSQCANCRGKGAWPSAGGMGPVFRLAAPQLQIRNCSCLLR